MDDILVSIIVPTYNIEKYISQTIECVLNQTYQNWEMEITDDCSKDNTVNIIKQYAEKDPRIHLWQMEKNSGAGSARNNSIQKARGRYIAFLDSDDWWYPTKLEQQMKFMTEHHYEFTFTAFEYADKDLNVTGVSHKPKYISNFRMALGSNVGTPGVIYDTSRIGKIYMPNMRKSEDWACWIKIAKETNGAYALNLPLWKYRTLPQSLSRNKFDLVKSNLKVYQNILHLSKISSILFFIFGFAPNHIMKLIYNRIDSYFYIKKLQNKH